MIMRISQAHYRDGIPCRAPAQTNNWRKIPSSYTEILACNGIRRILVLFVVGMQVL